MILTFLGTPTTTVFKFFVFAHVSFTWGRKKHNLVRAGSVSQYFLAKENTVTSIIILLVSPLLDEYTKQLQYPTSGTSTSKMSISRMSTSRISTSRMSVSETSSSRT